MATTRRRPRSSRPSRPAGRPAAQDVRRQPPLALIVLQGLDLPARTACCCVVSAMDPQGCKVQGFKVPTAEEAAHDFLWRIHPHAPAKGEVAVFNRSHYEDVLVTRVHKLVRAIWERRFQLINDWGSCSTRRTAPRLLKFLPGRLEGGAAQALCRAARRPAPAMEDQRSEATRSALLRRLPRRLRRGAGAPRPSAPWFTIPCDAKAFRNLAVARIVLGAMEDEAEIP